MKKKAGMTLAALLAAAVVLSVTAHGAEPPQAVIGSGDGGTAISITDITPREGENKEDSENDTKNYTVSSYYPVSVQTAEEGGVQLLVKTFLVPPDTAPTELIEKDLTRRGVAYEVTDILRQEQPGETEKKTVSQTMTLESETDKMEDILPLLKSTMDYQKDGFSGALTLDRDSIQVKETGTSNYSYQLKETKEYTGLDRNDPYYIPKTTEKNGVTLKLADVKWTPMASGAENSEVPSLFQATALYTGTAWGSKADGYTVTAEYTTEDGVVVIPASEQPGKSQAKPVEHLPDPDQAWEDYASLSTQGYTLPEDAVLLDGSMGVLTIPKLDLSAPVYETDEGGEIESMTKGVVHFAITSAWEGNIGLCSHNVAPAGAVAYFQDIHQLEKGDKLSYKTALGEREYRVAEVKEISEDDWTVLNRSEENRLTLITCITGKPNMRLMVQAVEE